MTVRTKSKAQQWAVWLSAALVHLAVYVLLSLILFNSVTWDLFAPRLHRLAIPLVVFFFYVAWNTRWDGVTRVKKVKEKAKVQGEAERVEKAGEGGERGVENRCRAEEKSGSAEQTTDVGAHTPSAPQSQASGVYVHSPTLDSSSVADASATGEELFDQARALPHQVVPDFGLDGQYLELLGRSAQKGYAPALTKLGEYAMRRAAWVEAYYWMKQAQRNGMHGLSSTLREIRKNWSRDGFPDQLSNVNQLFTLEAGSLGRALLHVDSGHGAAKAKEFLKENHPEF